LSDATLRRPATACFHAQKDHGEDAFKAITPELVQMEGRLIAEVSDGDSRFYCHRKILFPGFCPRRP